MSKSKGFLIAKNWDSDFSTKTVFFLWFFNRNLAKSRRTTKRQTVLSSLPRILLIPITLRNIYFLTHFRIFCHYNFFDKFKKKKKFSCLNTNGLEFKLRTQRGMAFHIVTIFSIMRAKTLLF